MKLLYSKFAQSVFSKWASANPYSYIIQPRFFLLNLFSFSYNKEGQRCHVFSDMTIISRSLCQRKRLGKNQ